MLNPDYASYNKFEAKDNDVKARVTLHTAQVCSLGIERQGEVFVTVATRL